jgi:hypothetical protein
MAYYEVVSLLVNQAYAFELPVEDLHLCGLDPDRDLLQFGQFVGRSEAMIANDTEYCKAQDEIRVLQERLDRLQQSNSIGTKGLTKAGIRKLIARLHEELAVYEGREETRHSDSN